MARNRKRAKERRTRRQSQSGVTRQSVATRVQLGDGAPDPMEHASSEVDLAEAQLALGRPDLPVADAELEPDVDELEEGEDETLDSVDARPEADGDIGAAVATPGAAVAAPRARPRARLVNFLQGSWRELQRVQWPDRRQVMQATGVVIGFVIIAGLYLALADTLAAKIMDYILK